MALRPILKTTALFHSSLCYQKLWKGLFITKQRSLWVKTNFCTGLNWVFEKITIQTHVLDISLIKLVPDSKKPFQLILIDLQKEFDATGHQILLKKMKYLGFSKNTITWFKFYLCEWKINISIKTSYSSPANLFCGAPHGSILRPLLFLIYINDLPQAVANDSLLYTDDIVL